MGERGSYVTDVIYCKKCLTEVYNFLAAVDPHCTILGEVRDGGGNAIAGSIKGGWPGEEIFIVESDYSHAIEAVICHPMRICVLAEEGEKVFSLTPTVDPAI